MAPYLREGLPEVRAFAKLFGVETAFDALEGIRTHAELDAPPAATRGSFRSSSFPTVTPACRAPIRHCSKILASHGYAVLSVVHPYEASAATLAGGRVVSMNGKDGSFLPGVREVFAEWSAEDETMAAVTRATTDAQRVRLLRGYLGGLHHTGVALRRWVDDTRLVVDWLPGLSTATAAAGSPAVSFGRIGVFGHSMGGVAAAQFCVEDARCKAGLNLDGIPQDTGR